MISVYFDSLAMGDVMDGLEAEPAAERYPYVFSSAFETRHKMLIHNLETYCRYWLVIGFSTQE